MKAFIALAPLLVAQLAIAQDAKPDRAKQVYTWLCQQQQAHGILGNQDNDNFAGLYPNALAAMAFTHQDDLERAEKVFDFYAKSFDKEFAPGSLGGFPQFANAATGELDANADRWIGDNAWLLIALEYHAKKTGSTKYEAMRAGIAKWLVSLQNPDGGIKAGFNKAGPMLHYSTEGNLDCYVVLKSHPEARAKLKAFLERDMLVKDDAKFGTYFKMGSTVSEPALDTCAWAIATLGPKYAITLASTEKHFSRTDRAEGSGQTIHAFADFVDKKRIWLEGSGEMAVAYNVAGKKAEAAKLIAELEKAMVESKAHPGTVGIPCSTTEPAWTGATTLPFTPSQAWYLFAKWDFNPMASD